MISLAQIQSAHSKVKSGADFPAYIREIKALGLTRYEAYVTDGHVEYHAGSDHRLMAPAKYEPIPLADTVNIAEFTAELAAHQQGKTDYLSFIRMCARTGIEKWEVRMDEMTCTYYDQSGNRVLAEAIPQ